MTGYTEEQKDHIDNRIKYYINSCAGDVKEEFYSKLKVPLIGLAAIFAVAVSIFATYLYLQAKMNVMQAQTEFASVKKEFYEDAMEARKEIDAMVDTYNDLAKNAEASVKRMQAYESTLETIANNYSKMTDNTDLSAPPKEVAPPSSSNNDIPPPLVQESSRPSRDIFQIPQQQQQMLR